MDAGLRPPRAIVIGELFRQDRAALVALLTDLMPREWMLPTACAGWDVRDVALHILGGDLGNLARRRDGLQTPGPKRNETHGQFLARLNQEWVEAARRFSPPLAIELLRMTGSSVADHLDTLDPSALGERVSWVGPDPAPNWLDIAREYMECWVHQQHIRDAAGRRGQQQARFSAPVIAASMHALPKALAASSAPAPASVVVRIDGDAGGEWSVVRDRAGWRLFEGPAQRGDATVRLAADDWWRVVTLGMATDDAWRRARVLGDAELARAVLSAVAIIA